VQLGKGNEGEAPAFADSADPAAIVAASIAYQQQQRARGIEVDDATAIRAVAGGAR
jgi:hypothetical protein